MAQNAGIQAMNAKRRLQRITLIGLAVLFVLVSYARFVRQRPSGVEAEGVDPATPVYHDVDGEQKDPSAAPPMIEPIPVTWPVKLDHDPFAWQTPRPRSAVKAGPDKQAIRRDAVDHLQLNAILLGDPPRVLINGQMYTRGKRVEGFEIVRIDQQWILVKKHDVELKIHLNGGL